MENNDCKKLFRHLASRTAEPVSPCLAEDIKQQIPHHLPSHRGGLDSINIIIDLRINKFAAAAVIILTMLLFANFLRGRDSSGLFEDGRFVARYLLADPDRNNAAVAPAMLKYNNLIERGKQVVFYGDIVDIRDSNAVLMHWRLLDGNYRVMFCDMNEKTVSAEQLIELQRRMLQNKKK